MEHGLFDLIEDSGLVDSQTFEALESKIGEVLDRMKTVQAEKLELQSQLETLRTQYDDAARRVDELTRECDMLKQNQRNLGQEELIRSKISALLAKLETA
jgi:FtsZ-binding cell division protein ZapB